MASHPYPVISPKSRNYISASQRANGVPCARTDYEREMLNARGSADYEITWDDAKGNPTTHPGGIFGFTHLHDRVDWYIVTKILPASERQEGWSDHVGHRGRNVLVLSEKLCEMSWETFASLSERPKYLNPNARVLGTAIIKSGNGPQLLWEYVNNHAGPFSFEAETGEIIYDVPCAASASRHGIGC